MVLAGLGAGLNELIALAGTSELVPVHKRAMYVGGVVFTILPFCPSPLWAQLITKESSWRFNGFLIGAWNIIGLVLVVFCYKEPARERRPAKAVLGEVDYIGGFLSTVGVVLFMMGMQWGAREVQPPSPLFLCCAWLSNRIASVEECSSPRSFLTWLCSHRRFLRVRDALGQAPHGPGTYLLSR